MQSDAASERFRSVWLSRPTLTRPPLPPLSRSDGTSPPTHSYLARDAERRDERAVRHELLHDRARARPRGPDDERRAARGRGRGDLRRPCPAREVARLRGRELRQPVGVDERRGRRVLERLRGHPTVHSGCVSRRGTPEMARHLDKGGHPYTSVSAGPSESIAPRRGAVAARSQRHRRVEMPTTRFYFRIVSLASPECQRHDSTSESCRWHLDSSMPLRTGQRRNGAPSWGDGFGRASGDGKVDGTSS